MARPQCRAGRECGADPPVPSSSPEEHPRPKTARQGKPAQGSWEQAAWDLGPACPGPAEELPGAEEDRTPGLAAPGEGGLRQAPCWRLPSWEGFSARASAQRPTSHTSGGGEPSSGGSRASLTATLAQPHGAGRDPLQVSPSEPPPFDHGMHFSIPHSPRCWPPVEPQGTEESRAGLFNLSRPQFPHVGSGPPHPSPLPAPAPKGGGLQTMKPESLAASSLCRGAQAPSAQKVPGAYTSSQPPSTISPAWPEGKFSKVGVWAQGQGPLRSAPPPASKPSEGISQRQRARVIARSVASPRLAAFPTPGLRLLQRASTTKCPAASLK